MMRRFFLFIPVVFLCACMNVGEKDGAPDRKVDVSTIKNPTPKPLKRSKYGNPKSYEVFGKTYHLLDSNKNYSEIGLASWYGTKFDGKRTSSGEPYDMFAMTAAHKTLAIPTYARVKNLENGKEIIVKINDRGPFHEGRIIDLSYVAAQKLNIGGTAKVLVETIDSLDTAEGLSLQAGAFSDRENAQRREKEISGLTNEPVHILEKASPVLGTLYKVQIGPLSEEKAQDLQTQLTQSGITSHTILQ